VDVVGGLLRGALHDSWNKRGGGEARLEIDETLQRAARRRKAEVEASARVRIPRRNAARELLVQLSAKVVEGGLRRCTLRRLLQTRLAWRRAIGHPVLEPECDPRRPDIAEEEPFQTVAERAERVGVRALFQCARACESECLIRHLAPGGPQGIVCELGHGNT